MSLPRPLRVTHGRGLGTAPPPGLLEACRQGERGALRALFELYQEGVFSMALSFTGSEASARDVAQDVFVKLHVAIRGYREESDFRIWLSRLVVNASMDEHRRARRFVPEEREAGDRAAPGSPEEDVARRQVGLQVRSTLAGLPPRLRLPLLLRYVEGLSYAEISLVLRCSMGTVASRLNRGHRLLAQRLSHLRGAL